MSRRSIRNVLMAALAVAGGLVAATTVGGSAGAAVVNQTMDCGIGGSQTMKIAGVYPSTVAVGGTYTIDLTPQPGKADGAAIKNLVWYFKAPTGSTIVPGSASVIAPGSTSGGTMGAVSAAISGTVVQLKVPGEIASGATFNNPTVRFQLQATGVAGTVLAVKAQANPAYTLTAAGSLNLTCTTTGTAASFTSTTIQAAATTTTTAATTTSTTSGPTTSTTAGPTTTSTSTTLAPTTTTTAPPATSTQTWSPVGGCGSVQTTAAPAGTTSVQVSTVGGNGGTGAGQGGGGTSNGGTGGSAVASFPASPGQAYAAIVGCNGTNGGSFDNTATPLGFGRGGGTGRGTIIAGVTGVSGGSGGGASAACLGTACTAGAPGVSPLVVAGGGGGGGTANCSGTPSGGGASGGSASSTSGGGGTGPSGATGSVGGNTGSSSGGGAGGAGGTNSSGSSADGGTSPDGDEAAGWGLSVVGGGGGGGFVGGAHGGNTQFGCKGAGGGGGGSSWIKAGASGPTFGASAGTPSVVLTFTITQATTTTTSTTSTSTTTSTTAPTTTTTTTPDCGADKAPFPTVEALVRQQYLDFVGRQPTTGELATEVTAITTCAKTADAFIETLIPTDQTLTDARLVRMYHAYFKRAPDPSGFDYWTRQLAKGRGIIVVAQKFAESNEFRTTYGALNNPDFVELVYVNVLDRPSEPTGKAFWVSRLDRKVANRGQVMANFAEANENITLKRPIVNVWRAQRTMRQQFPNGTEFTTLTTPILDGTATVQDALHTIRHSTTYATRF